MGCSGLAKLLRQVTIVQEVRMKSTKGKAAGCALAVGAVFMMFPGTALAADEVWNYRGVVDSLSGVVIRTAASESSGVAGVSADLAAPRTLLKRRATGIWLFPGM